MTKSPLSNFLIYQKMRKERGVYFLMLDFIAKNAFEIICGLISAGALAFCRYAHLRAKKYKGLLEEKKAEELNHTIDSKIEPIQHEIEELRRYIRDVGAVEKSHMDLIVSSYKFRLVQLCKEFIRQGFMTQNQYDQLTEFYRLYTGLGGNGQAKEYYETAIKLPIKV